VERLDKILDLIKELEEKEVDYFLITLRHDRSEKKADIFYKFQDEDSIEYVNEALTEMDDNEFKSIQPAKKSTSKNKKRRR
tara:strand:- start:30881 stop:31123 length:243 start_codon:yes stop_codon:yes gene_type:complete